MELAVAVLPIADLAAARVFYVEGLGFDVDFEFRNDDGSGMIGLRRETMRITLDCPMHGHGRHACVALHVDDADRYYEEWRTRLPVERAPRDEEWGGRTFGVTDPSGNTIFVIGPTGGRAATKPRVTSLAPQFLVDDLPRSIAYYEKLGFTFGEPWDGFYAIGHLDGLELHLKEAPKNAEERRHRRDKEHLDAAAGVDGIEAFFAQCVASGATILKPLAPTAWGTKDFHIEDPDGYVICFGGRPTK